MAEVKTEAQIKVAVLELADDLMKLTLEYYRMVCKKYEGDPRDLAIRLEHLRTVAENWRCLHSLCSTTPGTQTESSVLARPYLTDKTHQAPTGQASVE